MTPRVRRLLGVVGVLFVVALFASTTESPRVWRANLEDEPAAPPPNGGLGLTPSDSLPPQEARNGNDPPETGNSAWVIMETFLLGALLVWIVWAAIALRSLWRRRRGYETEPEPTFVALPDVASAITEDADAQFEALATGSPRNAIVACWVRLEDAVAAVGIARNPAETSAELTTRVLQRYSGGRIEVTELSTLYREARFSTHELGEAERARAVDALRRLHAELGLATAEVS